MNTTRSTITVLVGLVLILATGCAAGAKGVPATSTGAKSVAPGWPANGPDARLLVGKSKEAGVRAIQASTGQSLLNMPAGAAARSDWSRVIVATPSGAKTTVTDVAVQPGLGGPQIAIDGAWQLPTIGYDPTPVGLSADGSTAVLVEATPVTAGVTRVVSRFAIVRVAPLDGPADIVELPGAFGYDAISPDGKVLYVVEHLEGNSGRYQVRAVDLPAGTMRDAIIADKRNIGEAMAGWPIAQLRAPSGLVFTLYRGLEHPFIHALDTTRAFAVCIDLPATQAGDTERALHWGLAASPDWRTLYAANAALGLVTEVDASELTVRRSASVGSVADAGGTRSAAGPAFTLAKFGHAEGGPAARRTVVAPDGKIAYAGGPDGILAIRTNDLTVAARLLGGSSVDALGMTPDGRAIFALLHKDGRIVVLDAASGVVVGHVPGDGFDRLLAVAPW